MGERPSKRSAPTESIPDFDFERQHSSDERETAATIAAETHHGSPANDKSSDSREAGSSFAAASESSGPVSFSSRS